MNRHRNPKYMLSLISSSLAAGLETLRLNPLRTLLSTLGIIMGVGAMVAVLSLGDGMESFARKQIESTTDLQSVNVSSLLYREVDGERIPRTDALQFTSADVDSIQRLAPGSAVMMHMSGQALVTIVGDTTPRVTLVHACRYRFQCACRCAVTETRRAIVSHARSCRNDWPASALPAGRS